MGFVEAEEDLSNREKVAVVVGSGLLLASIFLPVFRDPFYHEEKVDFWTWLGREIWELRFGEKRRIR